MLTRAAAAPRRPCPVLSHSQDGAVRRVLTTTSDVGDAAQGRRGFQSPGVMWRTARGALSRCRWVLHWCGFPRGSCPRCLSHSEETCCPSARTCCFCPLAPLPRQQCFTFIFRAMASGFEAKQHQGGGGAVGGGAVGGGGRMQLRKIAENCKKNLRTSMPPPSPPSAKHDPDLMPDPTSFAHLYLRACVHHQ